MARYIDADALKLDIDLSKGTTVLDLALAVIKSVKEAPTADVAPRAEVAREIFEEIYETMNSVYASVQHSCVGMNGDNPETMRLLGKLEGVKRLGEKIVELKKKYQIESTEL